MSENAKQRNYAVALAYGQDDQAPRILASGPGEIAKRIVELARQKGIPIQRDDSLISILSQFRAGEQIPESCYRAVAEIFAFLFRLDLKYSAEITQPETP